jgi:uncharacterized Ntn-hydrolase superfamily protein
VTYSLLAHCPRSGRFGLAIASFSIAAGILSDGLRANIGATITQGFAKPGNNALALNLLTQGFTPQSVLVALKDNDPDHAYRQIVVIDREGTIAHANGERLDPWAGALTAEGCVAYGDKLAGPAVLDAMLKSFLADPSTDIEDRLLQALEAGRDAGGEYGRAGRLPERSAAVVVCGHFDYYDWDLRVDAQPGAIAVLRHVHDDYKPHAAYYIERARNPHHAIPAMEFADMLQRDRGSL